jgi:hypothetical protein
MALMQNPIMCSRNGYLDYKSQLNYLKLDYMTGSRITKENVTTQKHCKSQSRV